MKLKWRKCSCGDSACKREYPANLGVFYQGSGFNPQEKELVNRAFEALEEKEKAK